jgi:hypothetical protein
MNHDWQNPFLNLAQHSGFLLFFLWVRGFLGCFLNNKSGRNFLLKVNNFIFKHSKVIFFFTPFGAFSLGFLERLPFSMFDRPVYVIP